jgi:4-amino-4-deoxychorismate lyase
MRVLAMLDGTLADPEQPFLRVDDLGLVRGDGIFETVLVSGGRPRELGPHLDRLARSAAMLDLPEPDRAGWERAIRTVIDNWTGSPEIAVKLVCTRGIDGGDGTPTTFALGMELPPGTEQQRRDGVAAIVLDRGIDPTAADRAPWLLLGAKSLSYAVNVAALREAKRRGADDVIFTAGDGVVLEGPTANVVVAHGNALRTTPVHLGILRGTTQGAVFRAAERAGWSCKMEPLTIADLRSADGVFLASSVRKMTRVRSLDGELLPDATELYRTLIDLYESEYA